MSQIVFLQKPKGSAVCWAHHPRKGAGLREHWPPRPEFQVLAWQGPKTGTRKTSQQTNKHAEHCNYLLCWWPFHSFCHELLFSVPFFVAMLHSAWPFLSRLWRRICENGALRESSCNSREVGFRLIFTTDKHARPAVSLARNSSSEQGSLILLLKHLHT